MRSRPARTARIAKEKALERELCEKMIADEAREYKEAAERRRREAKERKMAEELAVMLRKDAKAFAKKEASKLNRWRAVSAARLDPADPPQMEYYAG